MSCLATFNLFNRMSKINTSILNIIHSYKTLKKMSGDTLCEPPRKYNANPIRVHDYLYDSAYIVSGARDYARTAFKAAMESAQLCIQPVYRTMFSELRKYPRMQVVYHPNCRLPTHIDRSYGAYLEKVAQNQATPAPELAGKDLFRYTAVPKKILLNVHATSPDFHPPSPSLCEPGKPKSRGTQSKYRESSAQTIPWQPDGKAADTCEETPEVLYLDKLQWGPGAPYRTGDLPADFHTTEIINKMRHARIWTEVSEKTNNPRWMKKRDQIISDIETKDWIFREAEIDELQDIRLELLHRLQEEQRSKQTSRMSQKLAKRWAAQKTEMERKISQIRRTRDRELRKLSLFYGGGGKQGLVVRLRAARGGGGAVAAAKDPASSMYAPMARDGYQARTRHAEISYDPSLLLLEDHQALAEPPPWLDACGQNLKKTCSGHHLQKDPMTLCERETKWSEEFLEKLHQDLRKARLGAAGYTGPLHVLKPRRIAETPRPSTPEVDAVSDMDEAYHQAALLLQRIIRGRAVQCLMYEGRTRAAELTEELKTTHGLQREDKIIIAQEEAKSREYNALRTEAEQKEDAITALVDELCGGAVSAALDFLEKELRRLKEERRQHAFILIALREKAMREAAEAGRRQKEEHRRREHDEMFKQIVGITQESVDMYLRTVVQQGVELGAETEAAQRARAEADQLDEVLPYQDSMSTAEQNELVAELVQQFLLPEAHRLAARHRIQQAQEAKMEAARKSIFNLLDDAQVKENYCIRCGVPLDETCICKECPIVREPVATTARDDPRWKYSRLREKKVKPLSERYPPKHDFRFMMDSIVDKAVNKARRDIDTKCAIRRDLKLSIQEDFEKEIEMKELVNNALNVALGEIQLPVKKQDYHFFMRRTIGDAMARTEPVPKCPCPEELPSAVRRREEERIAALDPYCHCLDTKSKVMFGITELDPHKKLLPSELRALEDLRRCKCDTSPSTSSHSELSGEVSTSAVASTLEIDEAKDPEAVAETKEKEQIPTDTD